jgi:methylated-DNA-[protein]-cysteine S-methyltransferase
MTQTAQTAQTDQIARRVQVAHRIQMDSPIGWLTIECDDNAITHIALPREGPEHIDGNAEPVEYAGPGGGAVPAPLAAAVAQLGEYFAGRRRRFDVPVQVRGTRFQESVWLELAEIPFGETMSYAELARIVGHPNAYRAVGQANGANPIPIILPCHRVVASGGGLGGYGGGLPMKRRLLALEGVPLAR